MNMNCRQCGAPIPNSYLTRDSFRCPECGKPYYKRRTPSQPQRQGNTRPNPVRCSQPVLRRSEGGLKGFITSRNTLLLIALIIGVIYVIAQIANISSASNAVSTANPESAEELGTAIGTAIGVGLLMPHIILTVIGVIFNAVAWFMSAKWASLTAAILYVVGGVLGFSNLIFLLPSLILCFVAYSKMKKQ